jgi:hypothetical protein
MQTREGWTSDDLDKARAKAKAKANNGNGFGLGLGAAASSWTTPQAHDTRARGSGQTNRMDNGAGNRCLATDAQQWATPNTPSGGRTLPPGTTITGQTPDGRKLTVGLENQAKMWGTPRGSDAEKGGPNQSFGAGGTPLPAQAANWPTPSAMQDTKGDTDSGIERREAMGKQIALAHRARRFSHPAPAPATWPHGQPPSNPRHTWRRLRRLVISTHGRAAWKRMAANGGKRRLNPNFVAWLMGWPIGHPSCVCSATEFSLWQQHMRGVLSALPTASGAWIWKPPAETKQLTQMEMF